MRLNVIYKCAMLSITCWLLLTSFADAQHAQHRSSETKGKTHRAVAPAEDSSPATSVYDGIQVVRMPLEDVPEELRGEIDTCAIDRTQEGLFPVFFLEEDRVQSLQSRGVALEHLGSLKEHLIQFAPTKTLRKPHLQSLNFVREALRIQPIRATADALDVCSDPSVLSLQPYDEYHTLAEGVCFIQNLAQAFPDITRMVSIGQSVEGRDIWALKITDNPDAVEPEEEKILFTGVTHAREWATHEMMLYLAEYLTSRYATDSQVQNIVNRSVVWLVPVVNPDGFQYTWTHHRMWRKNRQLPLPGGTCRGVDINRNYDYHWGLDDIGSSPDSCWETYRGSSPASEPETQAIQNLLGQEKFSITISYHTYSQLVLYAWGYTTDQLPESYTSLRAMGKQYAQRVHDVHGEFYIEGPGGIAIYKTNGDFDDYAYGVHGSLSFTPELRPADDGDGGFHLPEDQILPNNEENLAAALWLMGNVASAIDIYNGDGSSLVDASAGSQTTLSIPLTPIHQKFSQAFEFPIQWLDQVSTWLLTSPYAPPFLEWSPLNPDEDRIGAGVPIRMEHDTVPGVLQWLHDFQSYKVLPFIFQRDAEIMLFNRSPDPQQNIIGIPSLIPVRMADISIFKRTIEATGNTFGFAERILETRTALEDLSSLNPWIDWRWTWEDSTGTIRTAHPLDGLGDSQWVYPYRVYELNVHVPSWDFGEGEVYLLRFPGSVPAQYVDCNQNGIADAVDLMDGQSQDCDGNGIPDECESDCNENGLADACDIAEGASHDIDGDGTPDECAPQVYVPSEFATIQAAVDAAESGSFIVLSPGTYTGVGNRDITWQDKSLVIVGLQGPHRTIIDCEQQGRAFSLRGGQNQLHGLTIQGGRATVGGGIFAVDCAVRVDHCIVRDNASDTLGGGVYLSKVLGLLKNCLIVDNSASTSGGGIYASRRTTLVQHCTLTGNQADSGGGVFLQGGDHRMTSSIVWGNSASSGSQVGIAASGGRGSVSPVYLEVQYSNVQAGEAGVYIGTLGSSTLAWGDGNLEANPRFVSIPGPTEVRPIDLHLRSDSPCIDAGDPAFVSRVGESDIDQAPRIEGLRVDIGADEFPVDCNGNGLSDQVDVFSGKSFDCNMNGVPDECDVAPSMGRQPASEDCNANGVPDECEEAPCIECDLNGDGRVDPLDRALLDACVLEPDPDQCRLADVNGDGKINALDPVAFQQCDNSGILE